MTIPAELGNDNPIEVVKRLLDWQFRLVFWQPVGDSKAPREQGWQLKKYVLADYRDGYRVGIITGHEVSPGKFLHDVDIDWAPGSVIATKLLPPTEFVFGRLSKNISHCLYYLPDAIQTFKYEDIDKSCLIELRGVKRNGELGFQSMCPPSVWTKDGQRERLTFVRDGEPRFIESSAALKQRVCLAAIAMLLAKHFGINGFGHDPRLAWAGFMLRAGVPIDDIITMGEAISTYCNNTEIGDVRLTVESTHARMQAKEQKIKGGPALANLFGSKGKAIVARINEWLGRDSEFIRNADGKILADNQDNIRRALSKLDVVLSYNEFTDRTLVGAKPYDDAIENDLWLRIDEECRFRPTIDFFARVLKRDARNNSFHPIKQYLDALKWDGTPRIDLWLVTYGGAEDNAYVRAVSAIVLIAAVRRIRQPGCKYDEMLILEGIQGMEKSTALRNLCPDPNFFSDDFPLNQSTQQRLESTNAKWIIEVSDLAGRSKTQVEELKAMLSMQVDGPVRMAYARNAIERPRHYILIGTTNEAEGYLQDPTGARRFWPVATAQFNAAAILADRDQLWAEAAHREVQGESIRLNRDLWTLAAQQQERRREMDPWEDDVKHLVEHVAPRADGRRQVAASAIFDALGLDTAHRDQRATRRLANIMRGLKWDRKTIRVDGTEKTGYVTQDRVRLL